jgi:hypothetical protein
VRENAEREEVRDGGWRRERRERREKNREGRINKRQDEP